MGKQKATTTALIETAVLFGVLAFVALVCFSMPSRAETAESIRIMLIGGVK